MNCKIVLFSLLLNIFGVIQAMEKGDDKPLPLCTQLLNKKFDCLSHKTVVGALGLEKISVALTKDALSVFIDGKLTQFDANAGDNLCQVRAKMIASAFNDKACIDEIKQVMEQLPNDGDIQKELNNIEQIVKSGKQADIKQLNNSSKTLSLLLDNKSINTVLLSNRVKTIVLSNIITRFYSDIPQERKKKVQEGSALLGLTAGKLNELLKESRILLNKLTVACLDDEIQKINDPLSVALVKQKEKCESFIVPSTFGGMIVLLKQIDHEKMPIVLKAQVFCPDHGLHRMMINKKSGDKSDACFVIEGISDPCKLLPENIDIDNLVSTMEQKTVTENICPIVAPLKETLETMPLIDLVCANVAMHSQFVDKKKEIDFTQLGEFQYQIENEFHNYKQLALEKGLCKENATTFRIIHMFADINKT